jgi:hypothetical protein
MNKNNSYKYLKGKRKIQNNYLEKKPNESYLDPLTLQIRKNISNQTLYVTKFYFDDNFNLINYSLDKPTDNMNNKKNMLIPSLVINYNELLKLYNINNIIEFINLNIDIKPYAFINRILNCWIRQNFNDLNKNYKILIDIYFNVIDKFYKKQIDKNEINKYLKYWFKKKIKESFFLNLGDDIIKYLNF